jgi:hypothetical protein
VSGGGVADEYSLALQLIRHFPQFTLDVRVVGWQASKD